MSVYDFIEIGTSDFDTCIQGCNDNAIGLSIDPLQIYLDKLPEKKKVQKVCAAITGILDDADKSTSTIDIFYVSPEDIKQHNLPDWIRGCNSIAKKHPTTDRILKERNLENLMQAQKVTLMSIEQLFKTYKVSQIILLKIDTEGHDCQILRGVIQYCTKNILAWPQEIVFESNCLTDTTEIESVLSLLLVKYNKIAHNENIHLQIKNGFSST